MAVPASVGPGFVFGSFAGSISLTTDSFFDTGALSGLLLNGTIQGSGGLTKNGDGGLGLTNGANSYDGQTVITAGFLTVSADHALGSTNGGTVVKSGGQLAFQNVDYTTTEALELNGSGGAFTGALQSTGTNTFAGTVTLGSDAKIIMAGTGGQTFTGTVDSTGSAHALDIVADNTNHPLTFANTVGAGVGLSSITQETGMGLVTFQKDVTLGSDTSTFNENVALSGPLTFTSGGDVTFGSDGTKTLTVSGGATLDVASGKKITGNAATTLKSDLTVQNSGNVTLNGLVSGTGGLVMNGSGKLTLANTGNTYGGATTINAGTVSVGKLANGGSASSIGQSSNAATNLVLNGGTLQYTGAGDSTDRLFSVGTGGGTLDASGTGAINFTNTGAIGFNSQTGARTLTLTGINTGSNTLSPTLGDNGGATGLTKSGTGTWVLGSGTSSFSGTLAVGGGRLDAGAATLNVGDVSITGGTLVAPTGTLSVAGNWANTATFTANSGKVDFTAGTGTHTVDNGTSSFNNLTHSGAGTLQLTNNLTVSGNVSNTAGTLDANGKNINVGGNWSSSASFTAGTGTVTFNGTNQHLTGATTFNNLTKTVAAADTLTFGTGAANRTTVLGTLTLQGASGQLLSLRSSSPGTQWQIDPQGTRNVSFVDVQDSDNVNATAITANNSVTSGDNTNWVFPNLPYNAPASSIITIDINGTNVEVKNGSTLIQSQPLASTTSITINGSTGETLIVDNTGGIVTVPTINFNNTGTTSNTLEIKNGTFTSMTFDYTNSTSAAHDGDVQLVSAGPTTTTINFTNLAPVLTPLVSAGNVTFDLPAAASQAVLEDNGASVELHSNNGTFEDTTFANPTSSLTINRGNAGDTLNITTANLTSGLTVGLAGLPFATATISSPLSLSVGTGNLVLHAGTIDENAATVTTSGTQEYDGPVVLGTSANLSATTVTFDNTVDATTKGKEKLIVTGNAVFNKPVGSTTNLGALSVTQTTTLNVGATSVTTDTTGGGTGNQTYGGMVTLNDNESLTATGAGTIALNGGVTGNSKTLTINAATAVQLGDGVGADSLTGLGTLNVTGPTTIQASAVSSPGATQEYHNAVTLGSNSVPNSTVTLTASTVIFDNTVDATTKGKETLTVTGNAVFNKLVGSSTNLGALSVTGTTTFSVGVTSVATDNTGGGTGNQTYGGLVTLNDNESLTAAGTVLLNALTLGNVGTNPGNLTVTASTINLHGAIDTTAGTAGNVTLTADNAITELAGGAIKTLATLTTSSATGTTLSGANQVATYSATNTTSGTISLTNTASLLTLAGMSASGSSGITVRNTGDLLVTGPITAAGGAIDLVTTGSLTLPANASIQDAGGVVTLTGGAGGTAAILNLAGVVNGAAVYVYGGDGSDTFNINLAAGSSAVVTVSGVPAGSPASDNDTFNVIPSSTTAYFIDGSDGSGGTESGPDAALNIILTGTNAGRLIGLSQDGDDFSGIYAFGNRAPVYFTDLDNLNPPPPFPPPPPPPPPPTITPAQVYETASDAYFIVQSVETSNPYVFFAALIDYESLLGSFLTGSSSDMQLELYRVSLDTYLLMDGAASGNELVFYYGLEDLQNLIASVPSTAAQLLTVFEEGLFYTLFESGLLG